MVTTAKKQQALVEKIRSSSKSKAIFEIPFKLKSSNNIKVIVKNRWLQVMF